MTPAVRSDETLSRITAALVARLHPDAVFLFGSRARGDSARSSDYDLLVVQATSELPGYQRDREALRALRDIRAAVDVIVLTRAEFEEARACATSLVSTVLREGVALHAA